MGDGSFGIDELLEGVQLSLWSICGAEYGVQETVQDIVSGGT